MGVALQTYLRQMYDRDIAAVFFEQGSPFAHQMQASCPFVQFRPFVGFRQIVAIVDDDRDLRLLQKFFHRLYHSFGLLRQG